MRLFLRKSPSLSTGILASIDADRDTQKLALITQAVCQLYNSFLSIQGPPGTGKTYTASHVIVELLKQGKRIGIKSNSNKAINNLMSSVATLLLEQNVQISQYKVQNDDDELFALYAVSQLKSHDIDGADLSQSGVLGGTAWGFAVTAQQFDYLL
jgi:type II secretory pathway predicted ATPase ExeA